MGKKSRILYIKRYLEQQTDEAHPATVADILSYLAGEGISAHQRTVMLDIEQLIEAGVDIVCNKSRQNQYFIGSVLMELPELKLLIDAAQASKYLSVKRSRSMIDKLVSLASIHQAAALKSGLYFERHVKPDNEKTYITADILLTAINTKRRIQFMYTEYTPEKKKVYKHGQRIYEFSPWAFVWSDDSYYVIGHSKHHGKATKFRVERIASPKLTELPAVPAPEGFDIASFVKSTFRMFDGPIKEVTLKCKNELMKSIIDRFGEDVKTRIADAEHFYATVEVAASKTFYGWVFASDGGITITAPKETVTAYRDMLKHAMQL